MDRVFHYSLEKTGDKEKTKQFNLTVGMNSSALEHSVPEQLFSTTDNPAQGVSAVKALAIANSQGIPIYQINQGNINTVLPNLQLDGDTISDIRNAVNAGMEVTVSQTNITFKSDLFEFDLHVWELSHYCLKEACENNLPTNERAVQGYQNRILCIIGRQLFKIQVLDSFPV